MDLVLWTSWLVSQTWIYGTCGVLMGNASCLLGVEVASPALPILLLAVSERIWSSCSMSEAFWVPSLSIPYFSQLSFSCTHDVF